MATIVHFDISADNPERAKHFYEQLFDWKFEMIPGPMNYYLIETQDLNGEKGLGGGMAKSDTAGQVSINNFIGVASIEESMEKVVELGGKIIVPKQTILGTGYTALCEDTEKNTFGLFQQM